MEVSPHMKCNLFDVVSLKGKMPARSILASYVQFRDHSDPRISLDSTECLKNLINQVFPSIAKLHNMFRTAQCTASKNISQIWRTIQEEGQAYPKWKYHSVWSYFLNFFPHMFSYRLSSITQALLFSVFLWLIAWSDLIYMPPIRASTAWGSLHKFKTSIILYYVLPHHALPMVHIDLCLRKTK